MLAGLWDLVWAGEVTNDSLTALRALLAGATPASPTPRKAKQGHGRGPVRPNLRALSRLGPPSATGRWSLVAPLLTPATSPTERATNRALQLLERYGVLTREMALAEGADGGFAGVYPVLKELEDRGQVRRGYFVSGLGAAQFALPGAVDRLRDHRPTSAEEVSGFGSGDGDGSGEALVLAAVDPAQPFGAALPWPETPGRPARSVGSYVVLSDGHPVVYLERGAKSLVTFASVDGDTAGAAALAAGHWVGALKGMVADKRLRSIQITKINGEPVADSPDIRKMLLERGFVDGYRGPTFR